MVLHYRDQRVLQWLKESGIDVLFIPGGCTAIAQVMDVFVNAVFKNNVRKSYVKWRSLEVRVFHFQR